MNNFDINVQKIISKVIQCYRTNMANISPQVFKTLKLVGPDYTKEIKYNSVIQNIKVGSTELSLEIPSIVFMFNNNIVQKYHNIQNHLLKGLYIPNENNGLYEVLGIKPSKSGMILINLSKIFPAKNQLSKFNSVDDIFNSIAITVVRHELTHFIQNIFNNYLNDPEFEYIKTMLSDLDELDLSIDDNDPTEVEARLHENILQFILSPIVKLSDKTPADAAELFLTIKTMPINIKKSKNIEARLLRIFTSIKNAGYFNKSKLRSDLSENGEEYVLDNISNNIYKESCNVKEAIKLLTEHGYIVV